MIPDVQSQHAAVKPLANLLVDAKHPRVAMRLILVAIADAGKNVAADC